MACAVHPIYSSIYKTLFEDFTCGMSYQVGKSLENQLLSIMDILYSCSLLHVNSQRRLDW